MYTIIKWMLLVPAAIGLAVFPTRLTSHDFAAGLPFTYRTHQEVIGPENPHSFSVLLLLVNVAIALVVLAALASLFERLLLKKRTPS